ncbi:MAG: tetratricopeptide repeat protein [Persicimonas sp.]
MARIESTLVRTAALALVFCCFVSAGCSASGEETRDEENDDTSRVPDVESEEDEGQEEKRAERPDPKEVCTDLEPRECYFEGMRLEAADKSNEAFGYFHEACQMGHMSACYDLGVMQEQGMAAGPNFERAFELYEKACRADEPDAKACNNLAGLHQEGRLEQSDPDKVPELYERSCELGEMLGCRNLARLYRDAEGVERDMERAAELFERACKRGQPEACPQVTYLHALDCFSEEGCTGDPSEPEEAVEPLRRACEEDESAQGCLGYGFMLQSGYADDEDADPAADYYRRACDEQNWAGCNFLANLYRNGEGVDEDVDRAIELYEEACQGGFALSCHTLGVMHLQGVGTETDEARGYEYLERACDGGRNASCTTVEFQCFLGVEAAC